MILADQFASLNVLSLTSLVSLVVLGSSGPAAAQAMMPTQISGTAVLAEAELKCGYKQLVFKQPKQSLPGRREPVGLRCGNWAVPIPLTALIPESNLGVTTLAHPTFFWYLPSTSIEQAEFVLTDRNFTPLYRTRIQIAGQAGIIRFQLPTQAPDLEVDKPYRWHLELLSETEESDRIGNPQVEGWVIRIQPSDRLQQQLQGATPRTRPVIYASQGIWHETLLALTELTCKLPQDPRLKTDWQNLLQSVGLPKVAQEPLVACQELTQPKGGGRQP